MEPLTLTDGVLLLRPAVEADIEAVLRACQDREIGYWTSIPTPYARADAERWVRVEVPAGWATESHFSWFVTAVDAPDVLLASVGLHHLDLERHDGEIGYWAAPEARGRGIVTDAVRIVARWGFDDVGLERIDWEAGVGNAASRRVAEKVGFTLEGSARHRLRIDGRRHDSWIAGLLPSDLEPSTRPVVSAPARVVTPGGTTPATAATQSWPLPTGVEITAGSLHLRPFGPQDTAAIAATIADPATALWNPFRRAGTPEEDAAAYLARVAGGDAAAEAEANYLQFGVADATTGDLLGAVVLSDVDRGEGNAQVGYWTVPAARGRGIARHAVGTVSRWAFAELGLERIDLWHAVGNTASCRVAGAAGYSYDLTTRSSWRYGDDARHDEHLHARLATDPEPPPPGPTVR